MTIEEMEESILSFIESDIKYYEFFSEEALKLIAVAKAASKYIRQVQERRPEFVDYEALVCALSELEKE